MKLRWAITLLFTLIGFSLSAFAGSPQIGVLDPACAPNGSNYMFDVTGNGSAFPHFTATNDGGGVFSFCNHTNTNWTSMAFATSNFGDFGSGHWLFFSGALQTGDSSSGTSPIICNFGSQPGFSQPFDSCLVTITANTINIGFYNSVDPLVTTCNQTNLGILIGCVMEISLNDNVGGSFTTGDSGNWLDGNGNPVTIEGAINTPQVPEPTAVLLLASGMVVMWRRRRPTR